MGCLCRRRGLSFGLVSCRQNSYFIFDICLLVIETNSNTNDFRGTRDW